MTTPPKYEDVVAQLDAALAREAEVGRLYDSLVNRSNRERDASYKREAALREELATSREAFKEELDGVKYTRRKFRQERDALQQRLTVAERLLKRSQEFVAFVHKCCRKNKEYAPLHWQEMVELDRDLSVLKPAAGGHCD